MNTFNETKAVRDYDILKAGISRCDCCKSFRECFEFLPKQRLHNFDNLFLCKNCSDKCGFEIREGAINELNDDKAGD